MTYLKDLNAAIILVKSMIAYNTSLHRKLPRIRFSRLESNRIVAVSVSAGRYVQERSVLETQYLIVMVPEVKTRTVEV